MIIIKKIHYFIFTFFKQSVVVFVKNCFLVSISTPVEWQAMAFIVNPDPWLHASRSGCQRNRDQEEGRSGGCHR